jgi:micrococcal nuclease
VSRVRRLASRIALLISLVLVWPAGAADLMLALLSVSTPAPRGSEAFIRVQTVAGAACSIEVRYRSGLSKAHGLEPKAADARGVVSWQWQVGSATTRGRWPIVVTCSKGPDRGSLYTNFEVR